MSPYRPITTYVPPPQAFAPAYEPAQPAGFELADLIRMIDARRKLIIRVMLGTILCAVAAAMVLPTTWASSSEVMLDPRKNNITELTAVLSQLPADPASMQNQLQILESRELASAVIDKLHLDQDPEFNPTLANPSLIQLVGQMGSLVNPKNWIENDTPVTTSHLSRDRIVDALQKHVSAHAEGLSTSITITATARDGAKAAQIANAYAQAYVRSQVAQKLNTSNATTDWLTQRLNELGQQLEAQQAAVLRYKAEHNLNDSGPGNSIVDQQMVGISAQVVQARSDLAEKLAIKDRIDQLAASGHPADASQIAQSPLIVQLRTQQTDLLRQEADLNSKYGPLHPKVQAIQEQKKDLDFKINQEVARMAAGAANDVMVARAHLNSLSGSLGGTEGLARSQNMARVQLQALESNATSTRTQYEAFAQRLRSAQGMDDVQAPEARIISVAPIPSQPSGPKRTLIVVASIPLGMILGLLAALIAEKLGPYMPVRVNGVRRASFVPEPAAEPAMAPMPVAAPMYHEPPPQQPYYTPPPPRYTPPPRPRYTPPPPQPVLQPRPAPPPRPVAVWNGPPILAELNDPAQMRACEFVLDYPASKYSHAMAALVRQLESQDGSGAIIAVTSADHGESRSAIAVSLARAAARMGKKAIMVDCSPSRLTSRALRTPLKSGVFEVLTGSVPLNQALAKDPRGDAYLLGIPRRPPNAVTMFASRPMARLVQILRSGAEFVVIDCGPAGAGPDAGVIARLADATVLVSRRGQLHSPLVANAARILENAKAAPVGIVVTR